MSASEIAERAFETLLDSTGAASVLILLTAAVQFAFRARLKASWRFALWLPVLARLLVPNFPESPASLFNAPQWFAKTRVETPRLAAVQPVSSTGGVFPSQQALADAGVLLGSQPASPAWRELSVWVWMAGAGFFLGRLALGSLWLRWRLRRSGRASESVEGALRELALQMRVRPPRVFVTDMTDSPALFGLWRPRLLLPRDFAERFEPRALRHIFLHELAHLRRRDLLLNAVMNFAQALHWFNPLVWMALRQMRLEREIACDESALRAEGGEFVPYGQTILLLLEQASDRRPALCGVGIAEEKFAAARRLREIAAFGRQKSSGWIAAPLAALLVCGGLTNAQPARQEIPNERPARPPAASSAQPAPSNQAALLKLDQLVITNFAAPENARLADVLRLLDQAAKAADREGTGLDFLIHSRLEMQPAVDPLTGAAVSNERAENVQDYLVRLEDTPRALRLRELVQRIADAARPPAGENPTNRLAAATVQNGVVFMRRESQPAQLFTRTYKIDPNVFLQGIESAGLPEDLNLRSQSILEKARQFFAAGGVKFEPAVAPGQTQKAMFYNDRTGVLFVRATLEDIDAIESMVQLINMAPPQVTFEIVAFALADGGQAEQAAKTAGIPSLTGILTEPQRRVVLRALEQNQKVHKKVEFPRLTTLSGRGARSEVEGVGAVDMRADVDGAIISVQISLGGNNQAPPKAKLYDGQTLVLGADVGSSDLPSIFFVTVTIIDPAGNRVHHPGNMPFDPNAIPPQK